MAASAGSFGEIDDAKISRKQWGSWQSRGWAFSPTRTIFFIIGVVLKLLTKEWHLDPLQIAVVGAIPPLAAFWARHHLKETPRFEQAEKAAQDEPGRDK